MKNTVTVALLFTSALVHLAVLSARILDPVIWKTPSEQTEIIDKREKDSDQSGWTQEQSITQAASGGLKDKGWTEGSQVHIGYLEPSQSSSTKEWIYESKFGIFEIAVLLSFAFHTITILILRKRWSNQAPQTTSASARV
jgi:cell division protein FtsW (lipid II flippase)